MVLATAEQIAEITSFINIFYLYSEHLPFQQDHSTTNKKTTIKIVKIRSIFSIFIATLYF